MTSFTFGSSAASDGSSFTSTFDDPIVTAAVSDGVIAVGDAVTISGVFQNLLNFGGIPDGNAFYLGNGVFNGEVGYVFGDADTVAGNTAFYVAFNGNLQPQTTTAVNAFTLDPSSQTLGTDPACFLAGTAIATPNGACLVEEIGIDDRVQTADGRAVPVKWVGRQTVSTRFGPAARLRPVRVRAGALGCGFPVRDLVLTADHALLVDGMLITAGALVNGSTIDYVPKSELGDQYTVYHVETETHDVILAEGAPAETYIDYVARRAFDNYAEFLALYGEDVRVPEMPYPRVTEAIQLPLSLRKALGLLRAV